ncbi:MAG: serine/threonine protein kinase [Planctomycetes bacterium]|nr:serine/threonine protein kinase [Planctomycetota bacterium]
MDPHQTASTTNPNSLPEELIADFIARREAGEAIELDAVVRAHPTLESEIRDLYEACAEVNRAFGAGREENAAQAEQLARLLSQMETRTNAASRYSIEAEVGRGGMGIVYRVTDTTLDRPMAMKVILGQASDSRTGRTPPLAPRQLARFLNEARLTSQLDHPGIVPVHEVGVDGEGRAFFTMKLVKGQTLSEVFECRRGSDPKWSMPRILGVIQRVCEAMAFAHEKGIVHRDLKPQNVMVGDFGEVYVMDWGLARKLGAAEPLEPVEASAAVDVQISEQVSLTREGNVLGTPSLHVARTGARARSPRWVPARTCTPSGRCCISSHRGTSAVRARRRTTVRIADLDTGSGGAAAETEFSLDAC